MDSARSGPPSDEISGSEVTVADVAIGAMVEERFGAPYLRPNYSYYVEMRDGVRLALSVWLPTSASDGARVPTIFIQTRYGRDAAGLAGGPTRWLEEGFALAVVDVRGTAASFGQRTSELAPVQISDMADLVSHIATRDWSNGQTIATGGSYPGSLADLFTAIDHPAVCGAIVLHTDFDIPQHLLLPGGILNRWLLDTWGRMTLPIDTGQAPNANPPLDILARPDDLQRFAPVITPVFDDQDGKLLRQALTERKRWRPSDFSEVEYRDDVSACGCTLEEWSPSCHVASITRLRKPVQYWGSWMDGGTAEAALARYRSVDSPNEVWLTANDHGNQVSTDPFLDCHEIANPDADTRFRMHVEFARRVLSDEPIDRAIHYFPLGSAKFETTDVWPPADIIPTKLYLSPNGRLLPSPVSEAAITQTMDPHHSSGPRNRWTANLGVPALYGDRSIATAKMFSFTAEPCRNDLEIAGYVLVHLQLATERDDPTVFAYLDAISDVGRCTYLTEGMLRLRGRAIATEPDLPFRSAPPAHSHRRRDAREWVPGLPTKVAFALAPVAAHIRMGSRLRLSLASVDESVFAVSDKLGPERFTVFCGPDLSRIEVPFRG